MDKDKSDKWFIWWGIILCLIVLTIYIFIISVIKPDIISYFLFSGNPTLSLFGAFHTYLVINGAAIWFGLVGLILAKIMHKPIWKNVLIFFVVGLILTIILSVGFSPKENNAWASQQVLNGWIEFEEAAAVDGPPFEKCLDENFYREKVGTPSSFRSFRYSLSGLMGVQTYQPYLQDKPERRRLRFRDVEEIYEFEIHSPSCISNNLVDFVLKNNDPQLCKTYSDKERSTFCIAHFAWVKGDPQVCKLIDIDREVFYCAREILFDQLERESRWTIDLCNYFFVDEENDLEYCLNNIKE